MTRTRFLKLAALLLLCLSTVVMGGCISSRQLKDRALVQAVGIDMQEKDYLITLQVFSTAGSGGDGLKVSAENHRTVQAVGSTISEAFDTLSLKLGKEMYLGNNKIIVIGYDAAKAGVQWPLAYFNADYQSRPNISVVVAQGTAYDIVSAKFADGIIPASSIESLTLSSGENGLVVSHTLMDVIKAIDTPGYSGTLPLVGLTETPEGEKQIELLGSAFFREDKVAGGMNYTQTRGVMWLTDQIKKTVVNFEDERFGRVSMYVKDSKTKVKAKIVDDLPVFDVEVTFELSMRELMNPSGGVFDTKFIDALTERACEVVKKEVTEVTERMLKEEQLDLFDFIGHLKQQQYDYYHEHLSEWTTLLPQVQVNFNIHASYTDWDAKTSIR